MKLLFPLQTKFTVGNLVNLNLVKQKTAKSFSEEVLNKINTNSNIHKIFFSHGVSSLPHKDKRHRGGEDASCATEGLIGVADGVGGWNEIGVDPSLYSNELCRNIKSEYNNSPSSSTLDIFVQAAAKVKSRGTSTCCICKIDNDKEIETVNLGDSGYLLLRPRFDQSTGLTFDIVFKSEEQQHSFNFPYQVGENGDNPRLGQVRKHTVQPYDILILASDGLWDNVYNERVVKEMKRFLQIEGEDKSTSKTNNEIENPIKSSKLQVKNLQGLSDHITKVAEVLSLSDSYESPFAAKSRMLYLGGKHDDITLVVAQVLERSAKF